MNRELTTHWPRYALIAGSLAILVRLLWALNAQAAEADPNPEPPVLEIDPIQSVGNGRPALLSARVPPEHPAVVEIEATLGGRQVAVIPWDLEGRHFIMLAPVDIEETAPHLDLQLTAKTQAGTTVFAARRVRVEQVEYPRTEIRVSKRYTQLSDENLARAKQEKIDIKAAFAAPIQERLWAGTWKRPMTTKETSPFGTLRDYNKGERKSRHLGWDLDGKTGDPILASGRGKAVLVQDRFFAGRTVVLDHGQGLFTLYFHMSKFEIEQGDMVEQGQLIGRVGRSGRVTGPHLHFSVKMDGLYLDPRTLLAFELDDDPALLGKPPQKS